MEKENLEQNVKENKESTQPKISKEEMLKLLSETVYNQQREIEKLKEEKDYLSKNLDITKADWAAIKKDKEVLIEEKVSLAKELCLCKEELQLTQKALEEAEAILHRPCEAVDARTEPEEGYSEPSDTCRNIVILDYLHEELDYAKLKVKELRHHLADYPEDNYSKTDLDNCLLHINYLKAMMRRIKL